MHFGDEEKPGRKAALQKLMDMMGGKTGEKLAGLKKPAMAIEVEPEEGDMEQPEADGDEGEPSEEDKMKIAELYHKYCR